MEYDQENFPIIENMVYRRPVPTDGVYLADCLLPRYSYIGGHRTEEATYGRIMAYSMPQSRYLLEMVLGISMPPTPEEWDQGNKIYHWMYDSGIRVISSVGSNPLAKISPMLIRDPMPGDVDAMAPCVAASSDEYNAVMAGYIVGYDQEKGLWLVCTGLQSDGSYNLQIHAVPPQNVRVWIKRDWMTQYTSAPPMSR